MYLIAHPKDIVQLLERRFRTSVSRNQKNLINKKQWIRAIGRDDSDEGNGFNLKPSTKVCSRHFKETELNKSLNGIITLKKSSVRSKFSWTFRERTAPLDGQKPDSNVASINAFAVESKSGDGLSKERIELKSINRALKEKIVALEAELSQKNVEYKQLEQCRETNTAALKHTLIDREKEVKQLQIFEQRYSEIYHENKKTNQTLIDSEKEVEQFHQELENLQSTIFTLYRFKSNENISFYTGFPNFEAFMAIFKFLNVGENEENIFIKILLK